MQTTHTNKIKRLHNLCYYFTCGYDVDLLRNACTIANTVYHMPNIPLDKAHMYANQGASMVSQQK